MYYRTCASLSWALFGSIFCALLMSIGCAAPSASQPLLAVDQAPASEPAIDWKKDVGDILSPAGGLIATVNEKEQVYTVSVPRSDLDVKIDGMTIPTAAGIGSTFYFYHCSCGKISVLGEFIVADYEANDVIDALRVGTVIRIASVGPVAIGDRPRLTCVRFHGEGEATQLAKLIKEAMRWTGEDRMKPNAK